MEAHNLDEEQYKKIKDELGEIVREYLVKLEAAQPDDVIASMVISVRLASPLHDGEKYAANCWGTVSEAAGLAGYANGLFSTMMLNGEGI